MADNKKMITAISITLVASLGVGIAIGSLLNGKGTPFTSGGDHNNNAVPVPLKDINWNEKSPEDLTVSLSEVMLPEDEFLKLEAAILQTAMGLLMAQAQGAGITVGDDAQQELKKSIDEKYSRKYFSDMNANSMKELTKPELITVLSFYNTEAGQKFLKLSPKIIQTTMTAVQADLSAWLPKTVDAMVAKLKGGNNGGQKNDEAKDGGDLKKEEAHEDKDKS